MRPFGKKLKWVGISACTLIAIIVSFNVLFVWSTGAQLQRRIDALREAGEPVQLRDLGSKSIPPDKNGAMVLRKADKDLSAIHAQLQSWYPDTVYPSKLLSAEEIEKLNTLFDSYPEVMPILMQAADCPEYDPQLDVSLTPILVIQACMDQISNHRELIRVLRARSALLLAQGRADDAVLIQVLALRLSRAWRQDPLLIGYLVSIACESSALDGVNQVLQAGPVLPATRRTLDAELSLHDSLDGLRGALRSERAYSLTTMQELPGAGLQRVLGFENRLLLRLLDLFERHLRNTTRPYFEVVSEGSSNQPTRSLLNPLGALVDHLDPALLHARQAAERLRALVRSLRVLNAVQGQAKPDTDGVPRLAELGLPKDAVIDPFTGKPLFLKKWPEGWAVYSVGSDGKDDEGTLDGKTDFGFGPLVPADPELTP